MFSLNIPSDDKKINRFSDGFLKGGIETKKSDHR